MSNPNFDTLVATTLKNYRANLADNITAHQVVWYQLKERGFVREDEGGTSIVEPLLVGRNTTVKSYAGYDIIDTSPQTGITAAEFNWKQVQDQYQSLVKKNLKIQVARLKLSLYSNPQLHKLSCQ